MERKEVLKLAKLSHLRFTEAELKRLTEDLKEMISFADTVNSCQSEVFSLIQSETEAEGLREDETKPSLQREKIISDAESKNGMFKVKGGI